MLHFIKYNIIGIVNTLLTLIVVWILHQLLNWNLELSNFLGFVVGGANSYLMNRLWNFKSDNSKGGEIIRFLIVFGCAYAVNFVVLEIAKRLFAGGGGLFFVSQFFEGIFKSGFLANIVANVAYVIVSFGMYKYWVFKRR
ncbi:MAG: GtrA family protein [Fibrobacteraceae bacterium]|nr:GtrA family protein [Fibrobacteraceae bacterium]